MAVATRRLPSASIYEVTLSNMDVLSSFIYLPGAVPADTTRVAIDVVGLGPQSMNVDYVITIDGRLLWNAMGLDTVLSAGDKLRIVYFN